MGCVVFGNRNLNICRKTAGQVAENCELVRVLVRRENKENLNIGYSTNINFEHCNLLKFRISNNFNSRFRHESR